jgi:hypothetical protein
MGRTTKQRLALVASLLLLAAGVAACGSSGQESSTGAASPAAANTGAAFAVGDTVAARWDDGKLYLATVKSVGGGTVNVVYADDGTAGAVAETDVRAIPAATFAVGDRVLAVWSQGRFYPGKVTKVTGSSYTTAWDDDTAPSTVEAGKIIAK